MTDELSAAYQSNRPSICSGPSTPRRWRCTRLPLALNVIGTGVIVWIECSAEGFIHEETVCGLRIVKQHSLSKIEKRSRFIKSKYPELWVHKEWPGIPIGSGEEGATTFNHSTTLEVEAIMYTTDEDKYSEDETASDDV
jgi:hypothetical protein